MTPLTRVLQIFFATEEFSKDMKFFMRVKTKLDERYNTEEVIRLINGGNEIPVTMAGAVDNTNPFGVNLARIVGNVASGSAALTEDGQLEYDIEVYESLPLSKILLTLKEEEADDWIPPVSLSMKGTFDEDIVAVEEIICVDISA